MTQRCHSWFNDFKRQNCHSLHFFIVLNLLTNWSRIVYSPVRISFVHLSGKLMSDLENQGSWSSFYVDMTSSPFFGPKHVLPILDIVPELLMNGSRWTYSVNDTILEFVFFKISFPPPKVYHFSHFKNVLGSVINPAPDQVIWFLGH